MAKKKSIGLIFTAIAVIAAVVGMVAYFVNCGTTYFTNLGVNPIVAGCGIVAIILEFLFLCVGLKGQPMWADILPVVSAVLFMVTLVMFISVRVNGIASIMTFENNASNMADLSSAIVGIAACLIAVIFSITASFFDITKE